MNNATLIGLAGVTVLAGILIRKWFDNAVAKQNESLARLEILQTNPWLLKTDGFDSYQYYASELQYPRYIDVDGNLNYVSVDMLNNAMDMLHDQIITEVQSMYRDQSSVDTYIGVQAVNNPYWAEINQAIARDAE